MHSYPLPKRLCIRFMNRLNAFVFAIGLQRYIIGIRYQYRFRK
jgi:hypothetical protein